MYKSLELGIVVEQCTRMMYLPTIRVDTYGHQAKERTRRKSSLFSYNNSNIRPELCIVIIFTQFYSL